MLAVAYRLKKASGMDIAISIFDISKQKIISTCVGHRLDVQDMEFTKDGKYLISCSYDGSMRKWNVTDGCEIFKVEVHNGKAEVFSIDINENRHEIAVGADHSILIYDLLSASYESAKDYAHAIIQGKTLDVEKVKQIIEEKIEKYKNDGIQDKEFERAKRKIYGLYVREFNEVSATSIMFVTNYFKNINPFEYIESYKTISKDYLEDLLKEIFVTEKMVESCITPKETGE